MKRKTLIATLSAATMSAILLGASIPALARVGGPGYGMPDFSQFDANNDDAISLDEFQARVATQFSQMDSNGDGALSPDELNAARPGPGGEGHYGGRMMGDQMMGDQMMGGQMMGGRMGRGEMTDEMRQDRASRMMERMDQNGDGQLSLEELSTPPSADRAFERMDANSDGSISKDEFDTAVASFGGHRWGGHPHTGN